MCHLFVACSFSCPNFEKRWQPCLLSCPAAREHSRRTYSKEIYPCGNVTTLWNEDLCPYCLTAKLSKGASSYVREMLLNHPLRYITVPGRDRYMRWSGRSREEFDIEWRMENRGPRKPNCCCVDSKCKCGKKASVEECHYDNPSKKNRLANKWFSGAEELVVAKEKEKRYNCRLTSKRQETRYACKQVKELREITPTRECRDIKYLCKPQKKTTETQYKCKPTGVTQRYYTTTSPCKKTVYYDAEDERKKWEKEENGTYGRHVKHRSSERRTTYRRGGHDIDIDIKLEEVKPTKKRVSFSKVDKHHYVYY